MNVFKGDVVKTASGEAGEVIDTWGVARSWCKIRTDEGIIFAMTDQIESIIERQNISKRRKRR